MTPRVRVPPPDYQALLAGCPQGSDIERQIAVAWAALAAVRVPQGRARLVMVLQPVETWKTE